MSGSHGSRRLIDLPHYCQYSGDCILSAGLQTFLAEGVDAAVLEVGLGGRLDATNVVRTPFACGITPLGFDHMAVLGHTLPEIAAEKAGILKPGCPAFTVPQPDDAMAVIEVTKWTQCSTERAVCSLALS